MTPIKIEPNSGTKMAGVKVRKASYLDSEYLEIFFVGSHRFFSKDQQGVEFSYDVFSDWYLYEEPKPEVKKVLKPVILANNLIGGNSLCVYNANPHIKPARVVLKNVKYETVDLTSPEAESVSADLYFEVEE